MVIHDSTLDRTTSGKGPVKGLPLAELKKLYAGDGKPIPTLVEVIDFCKGKVEIQIELKDRNSPPAVASLIKSRWDRKKIVVTSFDLSSLNQFAILMPDVPLGLLNKDPNLDMIKVAQENGHQWVCPRFDVVTRELAIRAHSKGLLVYVYHVNDSRRATQLASWGVDAIGTDFPEIASDLSTSGDACLHVE
jgi:glycerophosphoryl diester phosphodiesterase